MANELQIDDGMTDAERSYFQTGGDVSDALVAENKDLPPAPPAEPAPAATPPIDAADELADDGAEGADDDVAAVPPPPDGQQEPQRRQRRVPMREFQAAQERAATLERQLQEQAVRNARVEERLTILQQAIQEPAQPEPQEQPDPRPDPQQDIFGYIAWQEREMGRLRDALNGTSTKVNEYERQITEGQAEMDGERRYFESMNTFAGHQPDFINAYNTAIRGRAAQLIGEQYGNQVTDAQLQGIRDGSIRIPQQIADQLRQEERGLYKQAFERNMDPAAVMYRYAQSFGYRPPAPNGNGAAAPAAAPAATPALGGLTPQQNAPAPQRQQQQPGAPGAPNAADVVSSIQRGQRAAQSLSNAGGSAADIGQLTPQQLADMTDEQFAAVVAELEAKNPQQLRELMGG